VIESSIEGSGEGLFAKKDLDSNIVVCFYNGLRIKVHCTIQYVDKVDFKKDLSKQFWSHKIPLKVNIKNFMEFDGIKNMC
jgi:hypothetical protein